MVEKKQYETVDEYIADYPAEVGNRLQQLRAAIHAAVPQAVEGISYNMPAFFLDGRLVYFAAYKRHIGIYPALRDVPEFRQELAKFKGNKGTLQVAHNQALPLDLILRMVRYLAEQNTNVKDKADGVDPNQTVTPPEE